MYNCHAELFSASHMLIVEREGNLIDGMLKQVQYDWKCIGVPFYLDVTTYRTLNSVSFVKSINYRLNASTLVISG
jgi:hypothetical protein